jgi:hypothetical protein
MHAALATVHGSHAATGCLVVHVHGVSPPEENCTGETVENLKGLLVWAQIVDRVHDLASASLCPVQSEQDSPQEPQGLPQVRTHVQQFRPVNVRYVN